MSNPYRTPGEVAEEPEETLFEFFPGTGLVFKRVKPVVGADLDRLARTSYGLVRMDLPDGTKESDEDLKKRCLATARVMGIF